MITKVIIATPTIKARYKNISSIPKIVCSVLLLEDSSKANGFTIRWNKEKVSRPYTRVS